MPTPNELEPNDDKPIAEPLRPATGPLPPADPGRPDVPATEAVASSTRTGPGKLRVAAVAGAAVALVVGAVATSLAAGPAQAPTQAATSTSSGTGSAGAGGLAPAAVLDPAIDASEGAFDHGRNAGRGMHDITITAVSGNSVSLKTDDGWTRTITVTDAVELTKGGQDIAVSDLAVGDQVKIRQTRNDDGTYTVENIVVVVPGIRGTVSDVSASGFKVETRDGSVWTIAVNGETEYQYGSGDGSLADVTNGSTVVVLGETAGQNALTALTVRVAPDRVVGTVTSKTADTIVIDRRDGTSVTIHVDGETTYRVAGDDDADLSDVTVDMAIGVSGRERADGSIDADTVAAGKLRGGIRDGVGRGGHRGFGAGDDDAGATPSASPTP
jgi:Domain of unknown function (DUF5666)